MNRRRFVRQLLAGVVGAAAASVIDPEALWQPGARSYFDMGGRRLVDPQTGISIRFVQQWDIASDKFVNRFDALYDLPEAQRLLNRLNSEMVERVALISPSRVRPLTLVGCRPT